MQDANHPFEIKDDLYAEERRGHRDTDIGVGPVALNRGVASVETGMPEAHLAWPEDETARPSAAGSDLAIETAREQ